MTTHTNTATFAAKAQPLINRGIPVFPCKPNKAPITSSGFKAATTDIDQIEAWGRAHPSSLVGVPTGGQDFFVLDIDKGHADGADGFATLEEYAWVLPTTRTHTTQSGGAHMFFKVPVGVTVKNSAGRLGPGLDIRGVGGYIIDWSAEGLPVEHEGTIADAPACLLDRLKEIGSIVHSGNLPPPSQVIVPPGLVGDDDLSAGIGDPLGLSGDETDQLLAALDPDTGYSDWLAVGQALHHENSGAQAGLDAWVCWSSGGDKFPGVDELVAKWASFGKHNGVAVTMRSVVKMARGMSPVGQKQLPKQSRRYPYADGEFAVTHDGVHFVTANADNVPQPLWICSPLFVEAKTRDTRSGAWGRLLRWLDDDGQPHQWAMPLELLQADGVEVRRELARLGLAISPGKKARDLLAAYLQVAQVEHRARCVERLGWHASVYVTPDKAIGATDELVVFQNEHALEPALAIAGTPAQWRDSVARLCCGNSRMVFAVSLALAAPLADIVGEDSGGFHLRGASSTGKTTALHVAASVWGEPKTYARTWRSTTNGLEALAALHNDGLLILDELSQCDPRAVGEAAYLLANGQGKARATRNGTARQAARWRLLFLSAGEESLASLMGRVGQRVNTGQEIRLADIPADANVGLGLFETLHEQPSPATLSLELKDAAAKYYGAVGVTWLQYIVTGRAALADVANTHIENFVASVVPPDSEGQALRVARRFALAALAGEVATSVGLTGWDKGEARAATRKCFTAWLDEFGGTGNRETRAILAHVRAFFEAHGQSRFAMLHDTLVEDRFITNRAGFIHRLSDGVREFLVLPEAFRRELCQGFDHRLVARTLKEAGWLVTPTSSGHYTHRRTIGGMGRVPVYVFNACMWEDEAGVS